MLVKILIKLQKSYLKQGKIPIKIMKLMQNKVQPNNRIFFFLTSILNSISEYSLYICFLVIIIQTFIKLNKKQRTSTYNILVKWACFIFINVLKSSITSTYLTSLSLLIAQFFLFAILLQGYDIRKQTTVQEHKTNQNQKEFYKPDTFFVSISKFLFLILLKIIKTIPEEIRIQQFQTEKTILFNLLTKNDEFQRNNTQVEVESPQLPQQILKPIASSNLEIIEKANEILTIDQQLIGEGSHKKKTVNSEDLSAIIRPNHEAQTLLSPNEQYDYFQFGQVSKSPLWNQFIVQNQHNSELIPQIVQQPQKQFFQCDEMIQLTKKSFQFFREVCITKLQQCLQIVIKSSNGVVVKTYQNFEALATIDHIVELKLQGTSRFFRFESNQIMGDFIRYLNDN